MEFKLPGKLLLGVSTAAAQIEGGDTNSNWNDWYRQGRIKDGTDPASANDHWKKWREDTELMASMGIRTYRFGVEWSRILPQPSQPDETVIAQYRAELLLLKEKGISPLLTIHHFSHPMWFEEKGGFSKRENLQDFLDFVILVVERFGDLVSDYITINEPNVYAMNGWFFGTWPPGIKSFSQTFRVLENIAYCHLKAYELIHRMRWVMDYDDTMVGFANHVRVFDPKNSKNPIHCLLAKIVWWAFQGAITRAMSTADFKWPLHNWAKMPRQAYSDFIGVNYYSRSSVSGLADGVRDNCPKNDLDWEIYPEGLIRCARELRSLLDRPIWVTENGTCDNSDRFRSRYIYDHLKALSESDLPFERYYHWCFCDNFEWIEGNSAKFGLVSMDPVTKERAVKKSGRFYSRIIEEGGVTQALYNEFVAEEAYDIR